MLKYNNILNRVGANVNDKINVISNPYVDNTRNKNMSIYLENVKLKSAINDSIQAFGEAKGLMGKLNEKNGMKDSWRSRILDILISLISKIAEFVGSILGFRRKPKDVSVKCVKMIKAAIDKNPKHFKGVLPKDVFEIDGWSKLVPQGTPKDRDATNDRDNNRYSKDYNPRPEEAKDKGRNEYPWKTKFDTMKTTPFVEATTILSKILTEQDEDGFLNDSVMRQVQRIWNNVEGSPIKGIIQKMTLTQLYFVKCISIATSNKALLGEMKELDDPVDDLYKEMIRRCKSIEKQATLVDASGMVSAVSSSRFRPLKKWLNMRRAFLDEVTKSDEYKSGKIHYRVQNELKCIRILNDFYNILSESLLKIKQVYIAYSKTALAYTSLIIRTYNRAEEVK